MFFKSVCSLFLCVIFSFSLSGQNWEVVRTIDFTTSPFGQAWFSTIGFIQNNGGGASGGNTDPCAYNSFYGGNFQHMAIQETLEAGVNYRLTVNAKGQNGNNILDFKRVTGTNIYNTAQTVDIQTGLSIHMVSNSNINEPGQDIQSISFSVPDDGIYWLGAYAPSGAGWAVFDNFTLERQAPAAPLSFTLTIQGSMEPLNEHIMAPEENVTICLTPDAIPTEQKTLVVNVTNDASPHFSNFDDEILTFEAGNQNPLCFAIEASDEYLEKDYTFEVKDEQNNIIASFILKIEPPCEGYAGVSTEICSGESISLGCPNNPSELCYKWLPDEDQENGVDDSESPNPTVSPSSTTIYKVYVSDDQGNVEIDQVTITVKETPEVFIDAIPSPPIIVNNNPIVLDAGNEYPTEAYSWKIDGVDMSTGNGVSSIVADMPGVYEVTVINAENCTAIATVELVDGNNEEDCSDALQTYFQDNGFYEIPIDITDEDVGLRNQMDCEVQDEAQLLISISGDSPENFANNISAFYESPDGFLDEVSSGLKAFVTKDENFCKNVVQTTDCDLTDISIEHVETKIGAAELGHWAHISGEVGGSGTMFISGKTPLVNATWSTQDPKTKGLIEQMKQHFEEVLQIPFDSERLTTLKVVTGAFITQPCDNPNATEATADTENCPNQNNDALICLSPAGIPVRLEEGVTIRFGVVDKYKSDIDERALIGFSILDPNSPNHGIYYAATKPSINPNEFFGYYNIYTKEYYETEPPVTGTAVIL